ncbi:DUF6691 family protein [Membranihabitans maritimus]|uniref:DUF6691 family protein n=1 Tax=Membranihabitans maritimus TaxID=2904244 RepID=UPI001F44FDDB|nr:DUF6691 family protein [Membranihabitans maritimus]
MKNIPFLILGIFFGIVLSKGEVISWFRIQEMFRFDGFHMYGVIGSAVVLGAVAIRSIKALGIKDRFGVEISPAPIERNFKQYIFGGTIFGLGWALTGACPGPIYTLIGYGYWGYAIVLISAVAGTFLYGILKPKLPH